MFALLRFPLLSWAAEYFCPPAIGVAHCNNSVHVAGIIMPFVFDYETVLAAETQFLPSKGNFLSLCPKTTKISKAAYSHNTDSMKGVDLSKVRRALNLPQRLNKTDYNKDSQVPQIRKVGTHVQNRKDNLCDTDTGSPKAVWM